MCETLSHLQLFWKEASKAPVSAGVVQLNEIAAFCEDRVLGGKKKTEIMSFFEEYFVQKMLCYCAGY